jgi:hypothetical protein
MENFRLGEYLRYALAGAIFLASMFLSYCESLRILERIPKDFAGASTTVGAALTVGALIYTLHRAIPYPILYCLLVKVLSSETRGKKSNPSCWCGIMQRDFERWRRLNNPHSLQKRMVEWADQVHFLYCATWAQLLAQLAGSLPKWTPSTYHLPAWYLIVLSAVAAVVHHVRFLKYDFRIARIEH